MYESYRARAAGRNVISQGSIVGINNNKLISIGINCRIGGGGGGGGGGGAGGFSTLIYRLNSKGFSL